MRHDVFVADQATNVKTIMNPMTLLQDTPQPAVVDFMVAISVDIDHEKVPAALNSETFTQHCSAMLSNIDSGSLFNTVNVSSVGAGQL